jgi:hypothetical protein
VFAQTRPRARSGSVSYFRTILVFYDSCYISAQPSLGSNRVSRLVLQGHSIAWSVGLWHVMTWLDVILGLFFVFFNAAAMSYHVRIPRYQ